MRKADREKASIRLAAIRDDFRTVRSGESLCDLMTEGGMLLYSLMSAGAIPKQDQIMDMGTTAKKLTRKVGDNSAADFAYRNVFMFAAEMFSDRSRLLLRPVEGKSSNWRETRFGADFIEQGQKYALFVTEMLTEISNSQTRALSLPECELEVTQLLSELKKQKKLRYLSAKEIADMLTGKGMKTSESQVKKTNAFKKLATEFGQTRNRAGGISNQEIMLEHLVDEQGELQRSVHKSRQKAKHRDEWLHS